MRIARFFKRRSPSVEPVEPKWICLRVGTDAACDAEPTARGQCRHADGCVPTRTMRAKQQVLANWVAVAVSGIVLMAITYAADTKLLLPGEISTAHSSIGDCAGCHANVDKGQVGWLHSLAQYANPEKDANACLTCHRMGATAMAPHGVAPDELRRITKRQQSTRNGAARSVTAQIGNIVFAVADDANSKVYCATCHKEHRNSGGPKLTSMPDSRCHTCHTAQFENFEKDHPEFADYPFNRRTRVKFDHAAHFAEHFVETKKKKPNLKAIPGACADCHTSSNDRRQMSVKPFATTCAACHLPQIVGAERATGPKGIALIALPGLDVETLKEKGVRIGEWPEQSEAELVPLMKLLLGRDKERRRLLGVIDKLDLLDLTTATDAQIGDVESFVWEVKGLMYALATSKASDVMKRIGAATGVSLDQKLMAKLIATMPRDVLLGAQREWLPGLMAEMKGRGPVEWVPTIKRSAAGVTETFEKQVEQPNQKIAQQQDKPDRLRSNPKYGRWRVDDFGELVQEGDTSNEAPPATEESEENSAPEVVPDNASDDGQANEAEPESSAEPEPSGSAIDAEAWAEFGGWYRKDFAVLYKPTGHADPFMKAWLDFSGHFYSNKKSNVSAPVFNLLTHKDAQGQCTKCHSVDGGGLGNRKVQWGPSSLADKNGRFTNFVHEPHFRLLDDRGCLTCHEMNTPKDFEKSYQTLNPARSAANFKPVEKKLCATCHKKDEARQDCQLCHSYHVTPLITPITSTKLPRK